MLMENHDGLFTKLCSYENLELAYKKARKRKTLKNYVIEFEKNLKQNLQDLRNELIFHTYRPKPLKIFIVRDPKTRRISKSHFRDRVVHHALCNIIEPIFDKTFIYDSYANRINKGTHKAIERFDVFKRKASKNNTRSCYILKADIRHYFETVNHEVLLNIIRNKINDERVLWLIKTILHNHNKIGNGRGNLGMPLGNLTSQFFANVYLSELDYFVKNELKAKYYIRYVDDFVILHQEEAKLKEYKLKIDNFLRENLNIELHPNKSKILSLGNGIGFLGFRIFFYHKLLKKSNIRKFEKKFAEKLKLYEQGGIRCEDFIQSLQGWLSYAIWANTYKLRRRFLKILVKF